MPQGITKINIRLMFLGISDIDTLNEKFQAKIAIESRWEIDVLQILAELSPEDQARLNHGKSISLPNYDQHHWHPQLYIENSVGDLKEQIRYSAKKSVHDGLFYICERRDVKGFFWEKLELQHFPSDTQELSISVASMLYDDKVLLVSDPNHLSAVNREAFGDQQEWILYERIKTGQISVPEYLHDNPNEDEDGENMSNTNERKRSIFTVTCYAGRQASYFYWNGYLLILFIMIAALTLFGMPAHFVANRLQTCSTLLLTSITLRWTMNRCLPTVSYLTSLDKYAIICIFFIVVECVWHGIMGIYIFLYVPDFRLSPGMTITKVDQAAFFIFLGTLICVHIALLTWLFRFPLRNRRLMTKNDKVYHGFVTKIKHQSHKRSGK